MRSGECLDAMNNNEVGFLRLAFKNPEGVLRLPIDHLPDSFERTVLLAMRQSCFGSDGRLSYARLSNSLRGCQEWPAVEKMASGILGEESAPTLSDRVLEFSRNKGTDLLMLLAIADFCDSGNDCPSVHEIATKCRMKSRNANVILAALRASGELEVKPNEGPHGTNRYRIVLSENQQEDCQEMTPKKFKEKFDGQSSVAKKIYEMVPIQDAWPAAMISSELMRVTKSKVDIKTLQGCLNTLKESGLIKESPNGVFKRTEISETADVKEDETIYFDKPSSAKKQPIEILADLSIRLGAIAKAINGIVSDIDTAAIVIDEQIAADNANAEKLKQLQSILKSLA